MSTVSSPSRRSAIALAVAASIAGLLAVGTPAQAQTSAQPVTTVVLRMTGQMTLAFDKTFLKTVKKSKVKFSVKDGAVLKARTATLPIDSSTTIDLSAGSADVLAKGTVVMRRPDGRKIVVQDIALRLRSSGADLSGTVRGRPQREFAALTLGATTAINQADTGYSFVDVQMLVSLDMAAAAKKAKIKGVKAGAPLGLMTAQISANIPSFTLPGLGGLVPGL